jgi:Immune Mapped Protein 2 (IMP2) N-terminal domain
MSKKSTSPTAKEWASVNNENEGPTGCYLCYESSSGGCLVLQYSQGPVPENAVGFWTPGTGEMIQPFKFKQNSGKSELIKGIAGGDSNRRKYFSYVVIVGLVFVAALRFRCFVLSKRTCC